MTSVLYSTHPHPYSSTTPWWQYRATLTPTTFFGRSDSQLALLMPLSVCIRVWYWLTSVPPTATSVTLLAALPAPQGSCWSPVIKPAPPAVIIYRGITNHRGSVWNATNTVRNATPLTLTAQSVWVCPPMRHSWMATVVCRPALMASWHKAVTTPVSLVIRSGLSVILPPISVVSVPLTTTYWALTAWLTVAVATTRTPLLQTHVRNVMPFAQSVTLTAPPAQPAPLVAVMRHFWMATHALRTAVMANSSKTIIIPVSPVIPSVWDAPPPPAIATNVQTLTTCWVPHACNNVEMATIRIPIPMFVHFVIISAPTATPPPPTALPAPPMPTCWAPSAKQSAEMATSKTRAPTPATPAIATAPSAIVHRTSVRTAPVGSTSWLTSA